MKRVLLASLLVSSAAVAGPYDQPYAIVTVDRAPSSDHLLRKVIVNRVDEETVLSDNKAVVTPGPHKITLDLPPRKGFNQATQSILELDAKPCTRYYVAAKLATTTTQEWTPVVRSQEAIGECKKKFKIG